ncbi:RidA family protein [Acetobacteraceae bacterium H6797]|nr:RidA family protein [Acetobacteraceae bacterium H6797]
MAGQIESKLAALGITLPAAPAPVANYVPYTISGNLLIISGQIPLVDGKVACTGKLGAGVSNEAAKEAARTCVINVLAQAKAALGDLDRVTKVLRLGGFMACAPEFTQHAAVMNGASDFAVEVFGDKGRHARSTIGVPSLPMDATVEVEAMFEFA